MAKIYFDAASSCFCQHEILFYATSTFFCWHEIHYFVQHQHIFVQTKLLFGQRQTFYFNTKLFFVQHQIFVLDIVHDDIFLWSHSSKNIITCQKINKLSFLCETKKLILFFVHHHFFIFIFYITHCQHVDLLRSGPGNKETLTIFHSLAWYIPKQLRTKSFSRKKVSYYLGLMLVKLLRGSHILVKLQACFSQILQKLIP